MGGLELEVVCVLGQGDGGNLSWEMIIQLLGYMAIVMMS